MGKMRRTSVHRSVVARVGGSTSASFVIKDFATEVANCRSREILESSPFRLLDQTFAIGVYPRGDAEEHQDMVGVFLRNKGQEAVRVDSVLITVAGIAKRTNAATIQGTKGWGWPKAISQEACREYVAARPLNPERLKQGTTGFRIYSEMRIFRTCSEIMAFRIGNVFGSWGHGLDPAS